MEDSPDGVMRLVAVDAPVVSKGVDDVQAVVAGRIADRCLPRAAVVLDVDSHVVASADGGVDGEGAAGLAGVAVQGGVGCEFGGAEDHVVCHGAVTEKCAEVGPNGADVLGTAWVGDAGGA